MRGKEALGTTKRHRTCPDKAESGIRMGDLLDADYFKERVYGNIKIKNAIIEKVYEGTPIDPETIDEYLSYQKSSGHI